MRDRTQASGPGSYGAGQRRPADSASAIANSVPSATRTRKNATVRVRDGTDRSSPAPGPACDGGRTPSVECPVVGPPWSQSPSPRLAASYPAAGSRPYIEGW